MVDRHTCTPRVKLLTRIHTRQTDRSRSGMEADEQNSMTYIPGMNNASSGHKGHTGRWPSASRLSISIQNQYGVSRCDVSTQRDPKPSPGHPYNWFLYRSQLNAAKTDRFLHRSHSCLWKLCAVRGLPSCDWLSRVCESNILKCRPISSGILSRRYSSFRHMSWFRGLYFSGTDRWLICGVVGFHWLQGIIW